MPNIFDNVKFINEKTNLINQFQDMKIVNENGIDCAIFLTDSIISECSNNKALIREACLLEGAKFDMMLNNWLEEGEDYRGLKAELRTIMDAYNMNEKDLRSRENGILYACKRIIQILEDINIPFATIELFGMTVASGFNPAVLLGGIVGLIVGWLINRLIRYSVDNLEYKGLTKDCKDISKKLRNMANDTKDKALAAKYRSSAEKLDKAVDNYS